MRTVVGGERRSFEIDRAMRRMLWDQRADILMIKRARLEETRVKEDDNGQGQPAVVGVVTDLLHPASGNAFCADRARPLP